MGAGAAGSLTGAAELFRFWVFPDCTFLDISKLIHSIHIQNASKIEIDASEQRISNGMYDIQDRIQIALAVES